MQKDENEDMENVGEQVLPIACFDPNEGSLVRFELNNQLGMKQDWQEMLSKSSSRTQDMGSTGLNNHQLLLSNKANEDELVRDDDTLMIDLGEIEKELNEVLDDGDSLYFDMDEA